MATDTKTLTRSEMMAMLAKDSRENTNWRDVIHLDGKTPLPEKALQGMRNN